MINKFPSRKLSGYKRELSRSMKNKIPDIRSKSQSFNTRMRIFMIAMKIGILILVCYICGIGATVSITNGMLYMNITAPGRKYRIR